MFFHVSFPFFFSPFFFFSSPFASVSGTMAEWYRWMTKWNTIAYYRVCAGLISIFRRWMVFIHMLCMMLGPCITDENRIEVKILLVALQYPLDGRQPSSRLVSLPNRRKLWVRASGEAHVYASLMRVIIKTHYEFQNVRSHLPFYGTHKNISHAPLDDSLVIIDGAPQTSLFYPSSNATRKKKAFVFLHNFFYTII